jgi:hypothetical protein
LDTAVSIHVVERGGRLIHFGAADIFALISTLQLKANTVNSKNKNLLQN